MVITHKNYNPIMPFQMLIENKDHFVWFIFTFVDFKNSMLVHHKFIGNNEMWW